MYDIPNSLKGVVNNVIATMPASVNNGAYSYDTIECAFNKRFQKGLCVDTSFDWTRRDDLRNNTASTSPLTQSDPTGNGYDQNVFPTVPNRQLRRQTASPPGCGRGPSSRSSASLGTVSSCSSAAAS